MFPYFEIWGIRLSTMAIGIVLSIAVFVFTIWYLCKKHHQDFLKVFYKIPIWIIITYLLWRYFAVFLATKDAIPSSTSEIITILRLDHFNLNRVGILLAITLCFWFFFASIKRIENKKLRADILFSAVSNGIILLGLFLVLWDTVIWTSTQSIFAIKALSSESQLTKFYWVFPVWLFLSVWTIIINIIVHFWRILAKKSWRWLRWLLWILVVINICFLFQNYPKYGIITLWNLSLDIKQYFSIFILLIWVFGWLSRNRKKYL